MADIPRRRWRIRLDLGADSLEDAAHVFEQLAFDASVGKLPMERVSGGCADGYILTMTEDPHQTPEKYASENAAYCAAQRAGGKSNR